MLELNKENFETEVLKAEGKVIVDFWSPSWKHCVDLSPIFIGFEEKYGDKIKFAKLNIADARRVAMGQKVMGLPTFVMYSGGEKVQVLTKGDVSEASVEEMIKNNI